ncbi:hypothetical protein DSO57_1017470 [Entomophthora muscae]|uniref:Uncharacterized protein n=1 Tax=Entomophthora muscae TaxID=34485 RepID=A0ACC2RVN7_9FUNG|nr:hypothetical protein DSO57_1017470 [Entomophthora muscae]
MIRLLLVISSALATLSIDHIYALGDSFTDTGRLFQMTGEKVPPPKVYWEGRFSDGRTWVEYLATKFNATLTSLAVGAATTDSVSVPDAYSMGIPGCIQQAKEFAEAAPSGQRLLVTFAFTGNDFFGSYGSVETYMKNMERCVRIVADSHKASHILISTSFNPKVLPYFKQEGFEEYASQLDEAAKNISATWPKVLAQLRQEYKIPFFRYSMGAVLEGLAERGLEYCNYHHLLFETDTCNHFTPFEIKEKPRKCTKTHMFHDQLHPTSRVHEAIAMRAYQAIHTKKGKGDSGSIPYTCFDTIFGLDIR